MEYEFILAGMAIALLSGMLSGILRVEILGRKVDVITFIGGGVGVAFMSAGAYFKPEGGFWWIAAIVMGSFGSAIGRYLYTHFKQQVKLFFT